MSPSRVGVLLDDDRVGAGRQHAAGEDARRLAGADACPANGWPAATSPISLSRAGTRDVGGAHRIAVHGGDVGGRLRAQRREIGGEHAAVRLGERRGLGRQRLGPREHAGERLGDRHQRHGLLLRPVMARLAAALLDQADALRCACRARPP